MRSSPPLPPPPPGAVPEPVVEHEPEAPQGSTAKVVLAASGLLAVVAALVVGGLAWLGTPGVCGTSTVESARFGYCLEAPGWEYTNAQTSSNLPYDELVHPVDASSVRILAVEVGSESPLDQVISDVRGSEVGQDGVELGAVSDTSVAGVPAGQWDLTLQMEGVELQIREVVFVRAGTAWKVQLISDRDGFDARLPEFQRILRSWIFR